VVVMALLRVLSPRALWYGDFGRVGSSLFGHLPAEKLTSGEQPLLFSSPQLQPFNLPVDSRHPKFVPP